MEFRSLVKKLVTEKWGEICRRSHHIMMAVPFVLVAGSLVLSTASVVRIHQVLDHQSFQYSAELFETKKMSYRKLTVLSSGLDQNDGSAPRAKEGCLNVDMVKELHDDLNLKELAATGNSSSSGKNQKQKQNQVKLVNLWEDCYSSTANYPVVGYIEQEQQNSASSCEVVGVSGAYDVIHPFRYECGGFITDNIDQYSVVLNTKLAWILFHSYQVLGAYVDINGTYYRVVGVVCEGDDTIAETTGVTDPRAYVQFNQLVHLANGNSVAETTDDLKDKITEKDLAVTCYEVLLTDPINNIAYNDLIASMTDTISYSDKSTGIQVINNTDRFNVIRLWKKYFPLKKSYEGFDGMQVPYHERSARLAERYVVFWAEALIISGVVLIGSLCNIYAIFHGKNSKHRIVEEDEEEEESLALDIRRV